MELNGRWAGGGGALWVRVGGAWGELKVVVGVLLIQEEPCWECFKGSAEEAFEGSDWSACVPWPSNVLMADLAIRSGMCILPNMWLSDPQTTPIDGSHLSRSTPPQAFCGYPARCHSVVHGEGGDSGCGSRNLPIRCWRESRSR